MATRSEISQALHELALLDPTSLLKAAQANLNQLIASWETILPADAAKVEILTAGRELHAEHPSWEIRAGDIAYRIQANRRKTDDDKRRRVGNYSTLSPRSREGCIPMPPGWKQELFNKINNPKGKTDE